MENTLADLFIYYITYFSKIKIKIMNGNDYES